MSADQHAAALRIVHEEAGRTLSKEDFDLCMRIAKRGISSDCSVSLPLMSCAFRVTEVCGPSGPYSLIFRFPTLPDLHAAEDEWRARDSAPMPRTLPADLTPPVRHVLSLMLWQTLPIANALRASGRHINRKNEDEQAAALHWLLGIALEHGEDWESAAARALHKLLNEKKGI